MLCGYPPPGRAYLSKPVKPRNCLKLNSYFTMEIYTPGNIDHPMRKSNGPTNLLRAIHQAQEPTALSYLCFGG